MEIARQLKKRHCKSLTSSLISHCPTIPSQPICCGHSSFIFILSHSLFPTIRIFTKHITMAGPQSTTSTRQRQNTDQPSPQARTHTTRTRRPSFRRQHQQNRHQLPEEDRFVELRRSARIARLHQEQHRELHIQQHQPASTMADVARRTYARNDHGPRSVE